METKQLYIIECHDLLQERQLSRWVKSVGRSARKFGICYEKHKARRMSGGVAEAARLWLEPSAKISGIELRVVPV